MKPRRTPSSSCLTHDERAVLFHRRILPVCFIVIFALLFVNGPDTPRQRTIDVRRLAQQAFTYPGHLLRGSSQAKCIPYIRDNGNLEIRLHMTETHNTEGRRQYRIPRYPATRVPTTASMETRVTASPTGHTLQTASQAEKAYGFKVYCSTSLLAGISRDPSIQFETAYSGSFTHHRKSSP